MKSAQVGGQKIYPTTQGWGEEIEMLIKKIETALLDQISKEAHASNSYLAMASWCQVKGFRGSASFFLTQSEEERQHMLKLINFVNESGGQGIIPALQEPLAKYKSLVHAFEVAFEHEIATTKSIHELVDLTFSSKDYATFNFLQWYVAEQHEEESLFRSVLDLIHIAGDEQRNLLIVDNEIAKIRIKA